MIRLRLVTFLLVILAPLLALADEGEWAHLTGRFLFDGDPPAPKKFPITKDSALFGDAIADESLIVNEKNQGIANVLIFLLPEEGDKTLVHPSYAKTANSKVELAMEHGRFVPHVLLLRTSQTLIQRDKDDSGHNATIHGVSNPPKAALLPSSNLVELRYTKEESLPVPVVCNIHPWMRGFVLLRSNPYMAKTDLDGRFAIENLPVGRHVFRLWHERAGYLRNVTIGSLATDSKGRLALTIHAGTNELADTRLAPNIFDPEK